MSITSAVTALRHTTLFATLGEDKLNVIAFGAERFRFSEDDILIETGDMPPECYIILRGTVQVTSSRPGEAKLSRELGPGTAIGEVALLTNKPNSVTAIGLENGEALRVTRTLFERMLDDFPEIAPVLRDTIAARIRATLSEMTALERALRLPDGDGPRQRSGRAPARDPRAAPSRGRHPQR